MQTVKQKSRKMNRRSATLIQQLHIKQEQATLAMLAHRSHEQLLKDLIAEMNAKNRAYYFILAHGHYAASRFTTH